MTNSIQERILYLYDFLKTNQKGLSKLMETSTTSLHNLEKGIAKNPSTDVAVSLYRNVGISPLWLLTGEGNVLEKENRSDTLTIQMLQRQIALLEEANSSLKFTEALFKREKMKEPEFANFTKPNTEKGRVLPHPAMVTGATCGVVANF
jgi:transcriptional regulator with XRE-family HTH domain